MISDFFHIPLPWLACILGLLTGVCSGVGTRQAMKDLQLPPGRWPMAFGIVGAMLGACFVWMAMAWNSQSTPEVIPAPGWKEARVLYHLTFIALLTIITATDLRSYFILDWCCKVGVVIAVLGAVISGQFQLAHVWVDWNAEIPQLRGPFIPAWLSAHPHLHGLAWSLAGMCCGIGLTWLIRWIGSWILGMNALGSGDILLMAMVGAYLGWQPTVVITLLAPVLALGIGGLERLRGNRAALPYGPFLALASVLVLFFWRWIWMAEFVLSSHAVRDRVSMFAVRRFFGDPISMLLAAGLSVGLLVLLLGLLRIYKSLPIGRHRSP
ncbi:prepilin peptidase [Planctomicrobium sp. SH661]|uniref:prepilin peptidase n=1 Tax=Planctomicrobium sp. SH661 TaxID=3448124 RepID=UPI003F5AE0AB